MNDGIQPQYTGTDGQVYVVLEHPERGIETRMLADLVLEAFRGPRPTPEHRAVHLNGDKENNNLRNLVWGIPA